jgi:predicted transcriptional regulator
MLKQPLPAKTRTTPSAQRKATTFRLDPPLQEGLVLLQAVLKKPLNRLVNEAVQGFIERRTADVEAELRQVLTRVQAYRRSDLKFEKAIAQFAVAEAGMGRDDPAEGRLQARPGPAQAMVQDLLRG